MLYPLRLFFERTIKFHNTISSLGNVYRNSKWSDLKIQNIKNSFLIQFSNIYVLLSISIFIVVIFIKVGYVDLNLLKIIPYRCWYAFQDLITYLFILLLSLVHSIINKFNYFFYNKLLNLFTIEDYRNLDSYINNRLLSKNIIVNNVNSSNKDILLLSWYIQKTLNLLSTLEKKPAVPTKDNLVLNFSNVKNYDQEIKNLLYIEVNNKFTINSKNTYSIINSENTFCLNKVNKKFANIFTNDTNIKEINLNLFGYQKLFLFNIKNNIEYGKQVKWLWKSSVLSNKLITKLSNVTHWKKLYGVPTLMDSNSNYNIWVSSKLENNINFLKLKQNEVNNNINLNTNYILNNNFFNINNYESSIFWLIKRYKFLHDSSKNQQYINYKNNTSFLTKKVLSYNNILLNFLIYNYNFSQTSLSQYNVNKNFYALNINSKINNYTNYLSSELITLSDSDFIKNMWNNSLNNSSKVYYYSNFSH